MSDKGEREEVVVDGHLEVHVLWAVIVGPTNVRAHLIRVCFTLVQGRLSENEENKNRNCSVPPIRFEFPGIFKSQH